MRLFSSVAVLSAIVLSGLGLHAVAQDLASVVNVVRVSVLAVDLPATRAGSCVVKGQVSDVLAGQAFKRGQAIKIDVPCSLEPSKVDSRPTSRFAELMGPDGLDARALAASKSGLASLDAKGRLIWSGRSIKGVPPGNETIPWMGGYRMLDGAVMPLSKGEVS